MKHTALTRTKNNLLSGNLLSDEHYTRYEEIAKELQLYKPQIEGQRILCPCDWDVSGDGACTKTYIVKKINGKPELWETTDYYFKSSAKWKKTNKADIKKILSHKQAPLCNFWKYLTNQMISGWKIKSVTFAGYNPSTGKGIPFQEHDYSKYDLVITNPPFSCMEELINLMNANETKFLIIGDLLKMSRKNLGKMFVDNTFWLGYTCPHKFLMPYLTKEEFELDRKKPKKLQVYKNVCWDETVYFGRRKGCFIKNFGSTVWYTNLDVSYRRDFLTLSKKYKGNERRYKFSKNLTKVLLCRKVKEIPCDYSGPMYVPLSFAQVFSPKQFKILAISTYYKYGMKQACDIQDEKGKRIMMGFIIKHINPKKELSKKEEDALW